MEFFANNCSQFGYCFPELSPHLEGDSTTAVTSAVLLGLLINGLIFAFDHTEPSTVKLPSCGKRLLAQVPNSRALNLTAALLQH